MRAPYLLVAACASTAPRPIDNTAASPFVAIDAVPPLAIELPAGARHDCRPSVRIRARFAGEPVIPCADAACIARALADGQPFLFEELHAGTARALVGIVDGAVLATYAVLFDGDPCGGICPLRGVSTIERCARLVPDTENPAACDVDVTRCFRCEAPARVETCVFR